MKYTKALIKHANILWCSTHQLCFCALHFSVWPFFKVLISRAITPNCGRTIIRITDVEKSKVQSYAHIHSIIFFHTHENQYMLFWLLKDAQLACKRCSFKVLLTLYWTPTKHLLNCTSANIWLSTSYKTTKNSPIEAIFKLKTHHFFKNISKHTTFILL